MVPEDFVAQQLNSVLSDMNVDVVSLQFFFLFFIDAPLIYWLTLNTHMEHRHWKHRYWCFDTDNILMK